MPERTSKTFHKYGGQYLEPDQKFEVRSKDVKLMLALGRIHPEEGERGYVRRDVVETEQQEVMLPESVVQPKKRKYARKAL